MGTFNFADFPGTRQEARALNLNKYFTGRPCKQGHINLRYVSSGECVGCVSTYKSNKCKYVAVDKRPTSSPILPIGCAPIRIGRRVEMHELIRDYSCEYYMDCCIYAWNGIPHANIHEYVSTWGCSESCKFFTEFTRHHGVEHKIPVYTVHANLLTSTPNHRVLAIFSDT